MTMSFGEISARLKKKKEEQNPAPAPRNHEEIHALRARILGVLIRDARLAKGSTQEEAANEVGVQVSLLREWEYGRQSPSLPQLEMLAYHLGVPVTHFWTTRTLESQKDDRDSIVPSADYQELRDRVIGVLLMGARKDANLTHEQLAEATGVSVQAIRDYEFGKMSIPFPELSSLASAVRKNMSYFLEDVSRIGGWLSLQEQYEKFSELPQEIRDFVTKPVNQPYIEIAMRLSQMPIQELRTVGEKILDITL
jgi:transcriptional regulator with XRE-family HTH domain